MSGAAAFALLATGDARAVGSMSGAAGLGVTASATLDTSSTPVDVRVSWLELDTSSPPVDVRVSWLELDTSSPPVDVRVSWLELDTAIATALPPPAPGGTGRFYTPARRRRQDRDDDVLMFLLR